MKFKIVSDSSSNVLAYSRMPFSCAPLKVVAGDKEYIDNPELNLAGMVDDLKKYKGKSGTSCPNVQDWLDAFDGGDRIFAVTITQDRGSSFSAAS